MRKLLPVVVMTTLMISCSKEKEAPNEVNSSDRAFIIQAYLAGKAEIQAGQIAIAKSTNSTVKNFAQRIMADYQLMQSDLIAVADKLDYPLIDTVATRTQSFTGFTELNGLAFDTAYLGSRVRSHLSTLNIFQNELNSGNNPYVRYYFLNKHVDKVKAYFKEADSLSRSL